MHLRWALRKPATAVQRDRPLVVSLTSYPPRFPTLHLTLKCLLSQTVQADRVILWVSNVDAPQLPQDVTRLIRHGLEIRQTGDVRSYKKIIPALQAFPDADIVTADDDTYYWANWLQELLTASSAHPGDVIAHRLHRITLSDGGAIAPYAQWGKGLNPADGSPLNFATGVGGVLYPAGSLHPDVTDEAAFMRLCPTGDDIWLYWMVRRNGRIERHSGTRHSLLPWSGTQAAALWNINKHDNDEQIRAMIATYGQP